MTTSIEPSARPPRWGSVLSLDLRSLAFFRIGLGLFTAGDVLHRASDLRSLYSDAGVLPRSALLGEFTNHWLWSVHLISDALWWQLLLVTVCTLAGLALAIGFRTWTATLVCWVLAVSMQNRNETALDGGDMVQRVLLFWSLFLPLGAIWSVDAVRRGSAAVRPWILTAGSAALTVQMASIFFFAAVLKTGDPWRKTFDAVWFVLHWEVYTTQIGLWIRDFPAAMRVFTIGTMVLEGVFPLLLFVPWAPLRVFAVISLIGLHAGFVVVMKLFMFASIMALGWFSLLPGWLWDRLGVPLEMNAAWQSRFDALSARLPAGAGWNPQLRWPRNLNRLAAVCLIYVTCWNIRTVWPVFRSVFPSVLNPIGYTLRIDQYWIMFAPAPVREGGWFVVPGRLADGRIVDVFRNGEPVSWNKPDSVAVTYINRRWRRYLWTVTRTDSAAYRKYFGAYLCREWARSHSEVLQDLDIVLMYEVANLDHTVTPAAKMVLWKDHKCQ